jgi:tetratricopeptide (TPR) repeat protein
MNIRSLTSLALYRGLAARLKWVAVLTALSAHFSLPAGAACDIGEENAKVAQYPGDPNVYVSRANCLTERPTFTSLNAAVRDLERALTMAPNNFYARHNYAQVAYLLEHNDIAKSEFSKAIALNSQSGRSYLGRGWAEVKLCEFAEANADFARAVSLDRSLQSEIASAQDVAREQAGCGPSQPKPRGPPLVDRPVEFVCGRDNAMLWCQSHSLQALTANRQAWIDSCYAAKVAQCN